MSVIIKLLLMLLPAVSLFQQLPAGVDQSKQDATVCVKDLRSAPIDVVLDGRSLHLSTYIWRDFAPSSYSGGQPMIAVFKVSTSDKKPLPSGIRMDRSWVLFGDQIWEAWEFRTRMKGSTKSEDSWVRCPESPVCEVTAREGPKWDPGIYVDVVVRLIDKEGRQYLLQAQKQYVYVTN